MYVKLRGPMPQCWICVFQVVSLPSDPGLNFCPCLFGLRLEHVKEAQIASTRTLSRECDLRFVPVCNFGFPCAWFFLASAAQQNQKGQSNTQQCFDIMC